MFSPMSADTGGLKSPPARSTLRQFDYDTKPKQESKAREIGRAEETEMMGRGVEDRRAIDLDVKRPADHDDKIRNPKSVSALMADRGRPHYCDTRPRRQVLVKPFPSKVSCYCQKINSGAPRPPCFLGVRHGRATPFELGSGDPTYKQARGSDDDVKGNNEECEVETAPPLCTHLREVTNEPTDEPSPSPSIQPSTSPVTDIPTPRPSFNPSRSPVRFPTTEAPTSLKPSQSPNLPPSQSPVSMAPSDEAQQQSDDFSTE
ncbi:hypothetical protein THAOC_30059, partial [Thalassiosira oceanica]